MSEVYSLEPSFKGRVIVNTSLGELDIRLWSAQCPKACRNFVQLCMEGYYNNCIFHRVIPNFMVQTGDPSGTGNGGESIYGEPFENEIASRLKFRNRGMVGMANTGDKCSNMSQFFITLDRADILNGKYTLFGKVEGHSVYNLLKIGKCEVGKNDRPLDPPKIISCQVIENPFDDIVPRLLELSEGEVEEEEEIVVPVTKDKRLLSFIDSDEDEDKHVAKDFKIKSAHDILQDKKLLKSTVTLKQSSTDQGTSEDTKPVYTDKKLTKDKRDKDSDSDQDDEYSDDDNSEEDDEREDSLERKKEIENLEQQIKSHKKEEYKPRKKAKPDPKKTLERLELFAKKLSQISKNEQLAKKVVETDQDMSDGSWFAGTKLQFSIDSNRAYDYDAGKDTLDVYDPLKGKDNRLDSIRSIRRNVSYKHINNS
ncbi:peptidyl-prolyl cis-trans isomerase [Theileria orientalis]|uniref:Peptidyl-prolyl cis-trans isomerase n=1 Tax=Theileria orientalis TaxID=68886 RepID=A0A976MEB5_THEOR|nr:peptidyl-prolyl cis-trans isomerase [Theileria orientalis]